MLVLRALSVLLLTIDVHNVCTADPAEKKNISWAGIPDAREEDEDVPRRKMKKTKKKKKKKPKPVPAVDKSDEI